MCLNFFTKFKFETIQMVMLYCRAQYPASLHTFFFFYLGLLFFFSDVIHTVGPIGEKEDLLSNAYSSVLGLLKENNLASVVRSFFFLNKLFFINYVIKHPPCFLKKITSLVKELDNYSVNTFENSI